MPIDNLALRKALKITFASDKLRRSMIRELIRIDIARETGATSGGGDFYSPFWSDAKRHALGLSDLYADTEGRIQGNYRRQNLYPLLRDGFLLWWGERRRWVNAPYEQGENYSGNIEILSLDATIRVENLLSVIDGQGDEYVIYPYFSHDPAVSTDMARIGLWAIQEALTNVEPAQIRLLDVFRGQSFALDRSPLEGTEFDEFHDRLGSVMAEYNRLREQY